MQWFTLPPLVLIRPTSPLHPMFEDTFAPWADIMEVSTKRHGLVLVQHGTDTKKPRTLLGRRASTALARDTFSWPASAPPDFWMANANLDAGLRQLPYRCYQASRYL